MKPGLFRVLTKYASSNQEFLDSHFQDPDWKAFQGKLKSKRFSQAVQADPRSDDKLRRFAAVLNAHKSGKGDTIKVPSQTSNKWYTVKIHPDGKLTCSCGDFTYAQSVKPTTGECKHIQLAKKELGMSKTAFLAPLAEAAARSFWIDHKANKARQTEMQQKSVTNAYQQEFGHKPGQISLQKLASLQATKKLLAALG